MVDVVEVLGNALNKDMQAINHVAQNLANVSTPGYKSSSLVTRQVDFSQSVLGNKVLPEITPALETIFDFKNGALQQSKRALDIAISGNAFFKISIAGNEGYSRNGALKINPSGVLVNSHGFPLITDQGEVSVNGPDGIKIEVDGSIKQNDVLLGKLELVTFSDLQKVEHLGNGILATNPSNVIAAESWVINQGYIEGANVNSSQEMVRMMELSKHFESVQKALSIYDQALSAGINKIGQ